MQTRVAAPAPKTQATWSPAPPELERKLLVGAAGDRFEQEADHIAGVVQAGGAAPAIARRGPAAQRQCAACSDEDRTLQRKADGSAEATPSLAARIQALRGGGMPLPTPTRSVLEPRLGHDLGAVRVHTGGEPAALSRSLGAAAFTLGRDVFFGAGRYAPHTPAGQRLLAHELVHTVQQGAAPSLAGAPAIQRLPDERVQRMDDATFESGTGVSGAITGARPTMTPVAGVHGATFTANGCPGTPEAAATRAVAVGAARAAGGIGGAVAGAAAEVMNACNVSFRFEKAYVGDDPYAAAGRAVRGAYVKIVMTRSPGCGT